VTDQTQTTLRVGSPQAPGNLYLVEAFLNTWSDELGIEDFETTTTTQEWLKNVGLWASSKKLTAEQHRKLIKFRSDLRSWILDSDAAEPLKESTRDITFNTTFEAGGDVHFHPTGDPYQHLLGALTKAIAESQIDGTWERFKCCELPTCGWAYYDSTRSRTKRWCSMKTCGSRHKAREYYKRKR